MIRKLTIIAVLAVANVACEMTPERAAAIQQFKVGMNEHRCAAGISNGSISTTGDRRPISFNEALLMCRGQFVPQPAPTYYCTTEGNRTVCHGG